MPGPHPHCRIGRIRFKRRQYRDDAGRFVSPAIATHERLINIFMSITPQQKAEAIERAKWRG